MEDARNQSHTGETDARLDAIVEEFLALRRAGRPESMERFAGRYPELERDLLEILPALDGLESLREASPAPPGGDQEVSPVAPRLGTYRLLRELGRGGMGVVYEAEEEVLGRRVALKVLPRQARLDPRIVGRFRREAQAAAKLHHTNIVPVFGFHEEEGVFFYTMQKIEGRGLDRILVEQRLVGEQGSLADVGFLGESSTGRSTGRSRGPRSTSASSWRALYPTHFRDVALLGIQAAEALAHAHERGVLHRDIKPSNLLVDSAGVVWVTDFGLARAEGAEGLTHTGELVGTCRYMAPEAFEGESGAAGDVYGLGVTLYEAATLVPAFDDENRTRLVRRICEKPPVRPRRLNPRIPRDLETIILKAIEKRPRDRYGSARALAADLRRFLSGVSPRARQTGPAERVWRWARRNPAAAASTLTIALLLATVAVVSSVAWLQTRASLARAYTSTGRLAIASAQPGRRWIALDALARAAAMRPGLALRNDAIAAAHLVDVKPTGRRLDLGQSVHSLRVDADLERVAFVDQKARAAVVRSLADGRELLRDDVAGGLERIFIGPEGSLVASVGGDRIRVWDVDTTTLVLDRAEPINFAIASIARGRRVARCSGAELVVVDLGPERAAGEPPVRRIDLGSRAPWSRKEAHPALSPDGSRVAVVFHRSPEVAVLDLESERTLRLNHRDSPVYKAAWHPTRPIVLTAFFRGKGSRIVAWDAISGAAISSVDDPGAVHDGFSMHATADLIFSSAWGDIYRVWEPSSRRELLHGVGRPIFLSADGRHMATVEGSEVVFHDVLLPRCHVLLVDPARAGPVRAAEFHPGLPLLATGSDGIALWDLRGGRALGRVPSRTTSCLRFLRDGSELLAAGRDGVHLWAVEVRRSAEAIEAVLGPPRPVSELELVYACVSDDARTVYATTGGQATRRIVAIDLASGNLVASWGPFPYLDRIFVSPKGRWLAGGAWGKSVRTLRIIDLETGEVRELDFGANPTPRFSPDGRTLAVAAFEGCTLVETGSWRPLWTFDTGESHLATFSPDGRLLACRSRKTDVVLVDARTGEELATLHPDDEEESSILEFSPDGAYLAGGPRLWDLDALRELLRRMKLDWSPSRRRELPPALSIPLSVRIIAGGG